MTAPYTFCIVDDDAVDRQILLEGLRTAGIAYEAEEVSSVARALELLQQRPFDLVFLDHHLPDGDGLTFLHGARELGIGAPVVVLTGQRDDETAASLVKAGAADYVIKDKVDAPLLGILVPRVIKASSAE
ncbi:MAG: response regulator, partial [Polyangiaceae bacterium]